MFTISDPIQTNVNLSILAESTILISMGKRVCVCVVYSVALSIKQVIAMGAAKKRWFADMLGRNV